MLLHGILFHITTQEERIRATHFKSQDYAVMHASACATTYDTHTHAYTHTHTHKRTNTHTQAHKHNIVCVRNNIKRAQTLHTHTADTLRRLLEQSAANKEKNRKAVADKYCYRQAEIGVGDCGGLRYIPGGFGVYSLCYTGRTCVCVCAQVCVYVCCPFMRA